MTEGKPPIDLIDSIVWIVNKVDLNFSRSQVIVFINICQSTDLEGITLLAKRLNISNNTMMRAARRLEKANLAIRNPHPIDGRIVVLQPTHYGASLFRVMLSCITEDGIKLGP